MSISEKIQILASENPRGRLKTTLCGLIYQLRDRFPADGRPTVGAVWDALLELNRSGQAQVQWRFETLIVVPMGARAEAGFPDSY